MKLKPGEVKCPKCKGKGHLGYLSVTRIICDKCWGSGKLDWIELIVGKRYPSLNDFASITFPLLRTVFPKLIAKDMVSVQPMTSEVFETRIKYGSKKNTS